MVPIEEKIFDLHARTKLPNGLIRTYSVVSREGAQLGGCFELRVSLDANSRGGSRYVHEQLRVGDVLEVGRIISSVRPAMSASKHIFVVEGIGITAFLALMARYHCIHWDFKLHFAVASPEDVPFMDRLEPFGAKAKMYHKFKGERMDVHKIVGQLPWNSHLQFVGHGTGCVQ